jgi:hypothetical protein
MTKSKFLMFSAHLIGNALLLLLGYYWLGLSESDGLHLAFSAAIIVLFALGTLYLHGTSLVLFREHSTFAVATKRTLRNILPLLILGIVIILIYVALNYFYNSFGHEAFNIGSYTTMKLRRPVEPTKVLIAFHIFIWILQWFVVPILAFPLAAEVANKGWSGFNSSAFHRSKKFLFWIEAAVILVAATHLPLHLFFWIPKMSSFPLEVVSVTLRIGIGYLLFTAGLLAVEYFTASGNPPVTQLNTAPSP